MSLVDRLLPDNPVLTKELRVRMRGARAYWILFGYLGFLSIILLTQYYAWSNRVQSAGGGSDASRIGNDIFGYLIATQVFLVLFITPAITSGSLTIENEQRTMDMLIMTRLPRWSIITGKLISAVSFTALLLISSLPLVSICFMLGSVDPEMVFSTYMMMLMGSFLIGAMGLMWSSIAKTTTMAVLYTYGTLFVLFVACVIPYFIYQVTAWTGNMGTNVFGAVGMVLFGKRFLGIDGPDGIGFSILSGLMGILFAAIAMSRLEMWPDRKAPLLRGLTLLNVGVGLLALYVWWLEAWYHRGLQTVQTVAQPPIAVLILTAMLLMAIVPAFTTGELTPMETRTFGRYLGWGWTIPGLKRGKMASGLPFVLIMTLFCLALYMFAFVIVGKPQDILGSGATAATTNTIRPPAPVIGMGGYMVAGPMGSRGVPATPASPSPVATKSAARVGDFPQAATTLLASVTGLALLCIFLSVLSTNRWIAWIFGTLVVITSIIIPEIAHIPAYSGGSPVWLVVLYYLNPMQAMIQMADPVNYYNNTLMNNHDLAFGTTPMWQVTSLVWLLIGTLSFALTLGIVARRKQQLQSIPYEEMAAH